MERPIAFPTALLHPLHANLAHFLIDLLSNLDRLFLQGFETMFVGTHPPAHVGCAVLYDAYFEEEIEGVGFRDLQFLMTLLFAVRCQEARPPTYHLRYQSLGTKKFRPSLRELRSKTILPFFLYYITPVY
jgi:hypothetical protein